MRITTSKLLKQTFGTLAVVLLAGQLAGAATFHFPGGIPDGYATPTSPASPSTGLQTFLGVTSFKPYDSTAIDQWFADTFENCPMCITGAELEIGLKPLTTTGGGANNDSIRFGFTDSFGNASSTYWGKNIGLPAGQQSVLPLNWGTQNYPNGVVLNLDLAALPLGNSNANGSTANLIPALRQMKFLDVMIQDDTSVDYIDLRITTALGGDVDGDGCVDAADLALFTASFNQPVPPGVGDPNGDGIFNALDLSIIAADFGKCCPEPGSACISCLGLVLLGMLSRRRSLNGQLWCRSLSVASVGALALISATASAQDYNSNAFVDAADYTIWQDNLGASVPPFTSADGDGDGSVSAGDYALWSSSFSTSPLSPSQTTGGPTLSIVDLGLDISSNRMWSVRVTPDATLFTNTPDMPDRGGGGSVAAEIGFEVVTGTLLSVTKNAIDFSFDNPGNSPFGFTSSPAVGLSVQFNEVFAALGSEFFATPGSKEMLRLKTLGPLKTKINWFGVYGPNGDQGRLAQAGINYLTSGMAMSAVPEPGSLALLATGLCGCLGAMHRRRCTGTGFAANPNRRRTINAGSRMAHVLCIMLLLIVSRTVAQPYSVIDLGSIAPGGTTEPRDINAAGHVVGFSPPNPNAPYSTAFEWISGTMNPLPVTFNPLIRPGAASAINANGVIVGSADVSGGFPSRAFKLTGSTLVSLGTLIPTFSSSAWGVNIHGDTVGTCYDFNGFQPSVGFIHRAGVMSPAGQLRDARDINDSGFVVGVGGNPERPMMWDSITGTTTMLGTLGGPGLFSKATAINNANQVVGWSTTSSSPAFQAYVWTASTGMVNLNAASIGAVASLANDINNRGEVVGSIGLSGVTRAAYWNNGVTVDLNTWLPANSGWLLETAWAISDKGCIVGEGLYLGQRRGFIMCVPEASTILLCALAAIPAGLLHRPRRFTRRRA